MAIHLAARETFAVDGIPACKGRRGFLSETDGGFDATHTLTQVTCGNCRRTAEFKRAERLGLKENDETWAEAGVGANEVAPQLRSIAMLDLMRLECSYLNDRPVVFMDDLYKLAKPNVGTDRANQLRDAMCAILSSTEKYPGDIERLAKEALARDNDILDSAAK